MKLSSPGPTLGIVGGGQLGRMIGEAAAPLGVEVIVSDPTPDPPAAPTVRDTLVGDFDDPEAVRELARRADVLTFEIELADPDVLEDVREEFGVDVHPTPETLRMIQDKFVQNTRLADHGIPVPAFEAVEGPDDLRAVCEEFGYPAMVKARQGGYDGRGNLPVESPDHAETVLDEVGGDALVEEMVEFVREISVIAVKGKDEVATYTAGENVHEEEILRETVVPARAPDAVLDRAHDVAESVLEILEGRGVYGIELFETDDGEILVNEIAPRPHNSGHWTIEGAVTSQFEQHARAVLGWPLGSTALRCPTVSANILGDVDEPEPAELSGVEEALATPGVSLHWYGKREVRPLRKMGHLTLVDSPDSDTDDLLDRIRTVRDYLTFSQ
ncbi:5-(carboxyamino)imidazole ribonucleotide synthase [Haladaptatus sp. DYSN1]|uniref:5-(carboxyamino)imidazole ribonucleotide synthase n=1 Tax=unclassified Haladaptatus TaxID=2622732 RepID=UPI002406B54A|nr:5-(carboxyamino)imidazole ribonucleotide synthase [Haladaptatus sp. DYSN1]